MTKNRKLHAEHQAAYRERNRSNPEFMTRAAEKQRRYRQKNAEKIEAHDAVRRALTAGKLSRPKACDKCHRERCIEAHHPDYAKPLEVLWLCIECHRRVHYGD